jgi:hypothetical protein
MSSEAYVTIGLALIAMLGASITSTVAGVLAYLKSRDAVLASQVNTRGIEGVHVLINSQLAQWKAELLAHTDAAIAAAFAKGVAHGEASERERTAVLLAGVRADKAASDVQINSIAVDANTKAVDANTEGRAP